MKQRKPAASREAVRAEIASLSELGFKGLRERWKALYGVEPPSKIGRSCCSEASPTASRRGLSAVSSPRPGACSLGSAKTPPREGHKSKRRAGRSASGRF